MQIPILLEPLLGNGYRALASAPFPFSVEAPTREEALQKLRSLIQDRLAKGGEIVSLELPGLGGDNPWLAGAGMFKDNPMFEEWQQAIAENRRKADEDPDVL